MTVLRPGEAGVEELMTLVGWSALLDQPLRPSDVLLRLAGLEGLPYWSRLVSGKTETAAELSSRGVPVEAAGPGAYVEVLEEPLGGGPARSVGRRLTDASGRLLRRQLVLRAADIAELQARGEEAFMPPAETVDIDDVAVEMRGLRCRFEAIYTARAAGGRSRTFAVGSILPITDWNRTSELANIDGFDIPKLVLAPHLDTVAAVRRYVVPLDSQRTAVVRTARELQDWTQREASFRQRRSAWEAEKRRLEDLLARRKVIYGRLWVRQTMYNRFDFEIARWTAHYNRSRRPASDLDPNIVKSMAYQESRLGTSGRHLMPPPSDWSDPDRHPIRSRFNLLQAIDSWGPHQWLMMQEMAATVFARHGLDALRARARWLGMSNDEYARHPTFTTALREFFEHASGGRNLMGTPGRPLHEDYAFWIRAGIRWLFHKYERLRPSSWPEAVRAYNGSGARARAYRDAVMARVGSMDPFAERFAEALTSV